jgi:DNA polymerase-3 subunit beta
MKLSVDSTLFTSKLSEANRFTASKSSSSVLSGYYLEATANNFCTIRTSTGAVIYETKIEAKVEISGSCVIPADLLLPIMKSLEAGNVELILDAERLIIRQKKFKSQVATLVSDSFPVLRLDDKTKEFVLPVAEFVNQGQKVLIAASNDETKPVLTSLMLEMNQPNGLVATDGFRLFRIQVDLALDEKSQFLLPAKVLKDFFAILEKSGLATVSCKTNEKRQELIFILGDTGLQVSAIQGEFPPYQAIIPSNVGFSIQVDKELLAQRVNQALIFAREFSSIVIFEVVASEDKKEDQELKVTSQASVKGQSEASLPCLAVEGQPVKFACNGRYVLDYVNACEGDAILIQGTESLKPVVFSNPASQKELYLIMPFKLQE